MTNLDVIINFVNGNAAHTTNVRSINGKLINYSTVLAERLEDGSFIMNMTKYSPTTSKVQYYLRNELKGKKVKQTTKYVPVGTQRLSSYL